MSSRPCDICGEPIRTDRYGMPASGEEVGEFYDPKERAYLWAHADCGLARGLDPA
jgi:hypothetical protein